MADIRLTISEVIDIGIANDLIPASISNIVIFGDHIKFRFKNEKLLSTNIDLEIIFKNYRDGMLYIEVQTNWILDKVLRLKKLPDLKFLQYKHPILTVFLQQFILEKTKIMHIESIDFKDGYFKIKTFNE